LTVSGYGPAKAGPAQVDDASGLGKCLDPIEIKLPGGAAPLDAGPRPQDQILEKGHNLRHFG
jgi:hypothetical protein